MNDILTLIEANLKIPDSALGRAMALTHSLRVKDPPAPKPVRVFETLLKNLRSNTARPPLEAYRGGVGLGWFLTPNPHTGHMIHWHDGATAGYTSYASFNKDQAAGTVVLANDGFGLRALLGRNSIEAIGKEIVASL